jgi:thioredoxin reductase (NADPH)
MQDAPSPEPIVADAVIIGAGPVGLFQVFELGLLDIHAHVIDSLPAVGGQCIELYPDKPIYDIPAVPVCTGRELVDSLVRQGAPFKPTFHLGQQVTLLRKRDDGRFDLATSNGTRFISTTVIIAAGVGAFSPRTLKVAGLEAFEGTQLHYQVRDPALFAGKHVVVAGGGDAALDWALHLVDIAASVVVLHRRENFRAAPASVAQLEALCAAGKLQRITAQATGFDTRDGQLSELKLTGADGVTRRLPLDMLVVQYGLSPRLGPVADWGLDLAQAQLTVRSTERFETSEPGIFAVGDITTYPGKKKLILSGFHEAALAAYGAASYIFPGKSLSLLYTTTSPKLHQTLGVSTPVFD